MIQANRIATWEPAPDLASASPGSLSLIPYVQEVRKWIRSNPQLATCGAILLGAGLGWVFKERTK